MWLCREPRSSGSRDRRPRSNTCISRIFTIRWKTTRISEPYGQLSLDTASQLQRFLGLNKGPGIFFRMRLEAVIVEFGNDLGVFGTVSLQRLSMRLFATPLYCCAFNTSALNPVREVISAPQTQPRGVVAAAKRF
jgi:hypothetical protein